MVSTKLVFVLATLLPGVAAAQTSPLLATPSGWVEGVVAEGSTEAFLGIPFAKAPIGDLRWRAPVAPEPWPLVRDAKSFAPACVQMGSEIDPETGESVDVAIGDEDCLYLNVWRPSEPNTEPRPIMVWIHGGANVSGSTDIPLYDGAALAASQNAVVISVQYRLNVAGFLNHPPLHTGNGASDSGNFGLLDQMKALDWVQSAAVGLGGDANKVMVFGESAGGYNVWSLMMSPSAEGLFQSAAIESGCPSWVDLEAARLQAERVVEVLVVAEGLSDEDGAAVYVDAQGDAWVRDYLYGYPMGELLEVIAGDGLITYNFGTIEDGVVLPADATGVLIEGTYNPVPTIVGVNRDESKALYGGLYPIGIGGYRFWSGLLFGDYVSAVEAVYPLRDYLGPDAYYERLVDMSDGLFELVCTAHSALVASAHHPVFLYRFDFDGLVPPNDVAYGATHTYELPFVFGNQIESDYAEGSAFERRELTEEMMAAWGCLARTGDPGGCTGVSPWPALDDVSRQRMIFDTPSRVERVSSAEMSKVDFWLGYPPDIEAQPAH